MVGESIHHFSSSPSIFISPDPLLVSTVRVFGDEMSHPPPPCHIHFNFHIFRCCLASEPPPPFLFNFTVSFFFSFGTQQREFKLFGCFYSYIHTFWGPKSWDQEKNKGMTKRERGQVRFILFSFSPPLPSPVIILTVIYALTYEPTSC